MRWNDVEARILEAVRDLEGTWGTDVETVAAHTALPPADVAVAVRRLSASGHLVAADASSVEAPDFIAIRLQERGLQALGDWPDDMDTIRALINALNAAAETATGEDANRLRTMAGWLGGFGRDVLANVAANLATGTGL
jgi:hypothetical protein